jgi:uncharacterized protein (DUF433 family)
MVQAIGVALLWACGFQFTLIGGSDTMINVIRAMKTEHPHIERRKGVCGGQPVIRRTRFKVRAVAEYVRQGMTPEELVREWDHLSLGQIYDALSYYYDHKPEIDRAIRRDREPSSPKRPSK